MSVDPSTLNTESTSTTEATSNTSPSGTGTSDGSSDNATAPSSYSSMAQLQTLAPQVYKAIIQGIAIQICNQSENFQITMRGIEEDTEDDD